MCIRDSVICSYYNLTNKSNLIDRLYIIGFNTIFLSFGSSLLFGATLGRLKTRDLTSRDHQNCGDWHCETGQLGTISQGWTTQDIWSARVRLESKIKPILRAEAEERTETPLLRQSAGLCILSSWGLRPSNRNSVFELLKQSRFEVIQSAMEQRQVYKQEMLSLNLVAWKDMNSWVSSIDDD